MISDGGNGDEKGEGYLVEVKVDCGESVKSDCSSDHIGQHQSVSLSVSKIVNESVR